MTIDLRNDDFASFPASAGMPRARSFTIRHRVRRAAQSGASAFLQLARWMTREMEFRRQARMLATLDDRMLADIGIWRGEISAVVRSVGRDRTRRAR